MTPWDPYNIHQRMLADGTPSLTSIQATAHTLMNHLAKHRNDRIYSRVGIQTQTRWLRGNKCVLGHHANPLNTLLGQIHFTPFALLPLSLEWTLKPEDLSVRSGWWTLNIPLRTSWGVGKSSLEPWKKLQLPTLTKRGHCIRGTATLPAIMQTHCHMLQTE